MATCKFAITAFLGRGREEKKKKRQGFNSAAPLPHHCRAALVKDGGTISACFLILRPVLIALLSFICEILIFLQGMCDTVLVT